MRKRHLSLYPREVKKVLRDYQRFGWSISNSREITTVTTDTKVKGKYDERSFEIWTEDEKHYSTTIEVEIYRYDEDIPVLWLINTLEFLYGLVDKLWWLVGIGAVFFTGYLIIEHSPDSTDDASTVILYLIVFLTVWLIAKLLKWIFSCTAEKIIDNA